MRPWLIVAVLLVCLGGCKSTPHPPVETEKPAEIGTAAPSGEASPFN